MTRFASAREPSFAATREERIRAGLGTRSIVMVGMPGCGKSALGKRLAPRLGLPFLDVDEEIDREARARLKHLQEGTSAWEVEYHKTVELLRRSRGLI